jgi:hypothetical protein
MYVEERFDYDERTIINNILEKESLKKFTKDSCLKRIDFQIAMISGDMAEEMTSIFQGLRSKIENLTDEEWDELKAISPLFSPEEPTEEELAELLS